MLTAQFWHKNERGSTMVSTNPSPLLLHDIQLDVLFHCHDGLHKFGLLHHLPIIACSRGTLKFNQSWIDR